ncbi:hypothetical protein C2S51_020741 [Perilla frutescens var. frutescens]|nr:hypothetical protein C2S51_020741 [Perilla frutescens var. frutescens]
MGNTDLDDDDLQKEMEDDRRLAELEFNRYLPPENGSDLSGIQVGDSCAIFSENVASETGDTNRNNLQIPGVAYRNLILGRSCVDRSLLSAGSDKGGKASRFVFPCEEVSVKESHGLKMNEDGDTLIASPKSDSGALSNLPIN